MKIFLDDTRTCPKGFVLAENYNECIDLLLNNDVEEISLDHDLGEDSKTGYDVTKFMVENNIYPNNIYLHSANPVGINNMYQLLINYAPERVKIYKVSYWRRYKNDIIR